ncbi:uncharacterized protein GJ701_006157 [Geothlypis trichas]
MYIAVLSFIFFLFFSPFWAVLSVRCLAEIQDFAAFKAKRGGERTSGSATARALPVAASGHRRAEEEMPGEAGRSPPFTHSRGESEGEKIATDQGLLIAPAALQASRRERGSAGGAFAGVDAEPPAPDACARKKLHGARKTPESFPQARPRPCAPRSDRRRLRCAEEWLRPVCLPYHIPGFSRGNGPGLLTLLTALGEK